MAHTKAGGSTHLGRDSASKRLGIKCAAGQFIRAGSVLARQRGTRYFPGQNVLKGSDDTLFATHDGYVAIRQQQRRRFDSSHKRSSVIHVLESRGRMINKTSVATDRSN